jgi:N-sulfoglucosamine sulfohydrolase
MAQPNIVYLHSHDTGRYIQPYGYGVPTPNLQRLAEEGMLFRQAFCASPTCSPSRASLLTGAFPHSNGMRGLAHFGFGLKDYSQHIQHTLHSAGYTTVLAGEQHIAKDPARIGYDRVLTGPLPNEERAAAFLRQPPQQPFFLDIGFNETHREYPEPSAEENPNYVRPPAPIPDMPETRRDFAGFVRSARTLDAKMGRVLVALGETGLAKNTLVICTTDHGLAFPAMKCNLTDHGTGIMLILRGPGGFNGGKVSDALVSQVDLFPTLCDLLGIAAPAWLQGQSLLPVVRGERKPEAVFSEINFHVAYDPQRAVRTLRWKYIRRFDDRIRPVLPNCDDSPSKTLWMEAGWRERQSSSEEQLYDLVFDPNEAHNLAGAPAYASVISEMRTRLEAWMRQTEDPLLAGPLEAPADAPLLSPDQTSPSEIQW